MLVLDDMCSVVGFVLEPQLLGRYVQPVLELARALAALQTMTLQQGQAQKRQLKLGLQDASYWSWELSPPNFGLFCRDRQFIYDTTMIEDSQSARS